MLEVEFQYFDRDSHGDLPRDASGRPIPSRTDTVWCDGFAPDPPAERTDRASGLTRTGSLYAPPGTRVASTAKARIPGPGGGLLWDIDGTHQPWQHPTDMAETGVVIRVLRTTG